MHRKSAYILFLAVLGLLALGIVILFSTGAFAEDSPQRRLLLSPSARHLARDRDGCLRRRRAGRLSLLAAHLVDLVRPRFRWPSALFSPALPAQNQWLLALAGLSQHHLSAVGVRQNRRGLFSRLWFSRYETESKQLWRGFVFPMAIVGLLVSLIITEVGSRHHRPDRRHFLCRHVHRRDQSRVSGHAFVRRNRRYSLSRDPYRRAQQPAPCFSPSRTVQANSGPAADAGPDRLGQRRDRRSRARQRTAKDVLPAVCAHRFHFSHCWRGTRAAL